MPTPTRWRLKKLTGVEIEQMLPTPNIDLSRVPECQKYLDEGSIAACTASARTIIGSGWHLVQRRGRPARRSARQPRGCRWPPRRRQDPGTRWQLRRFRAGLCARGNFRDRQQALQEKPLKDVPACVGCPRAGPFCRASGALSPAGGYVGQRIKSEFGRNRPLRFREASLQSSPAHAQSVPRAKTAWRAHPCREQAARR